MKPSLRWIAALLLPVLPLCAQIPAANQLPPDKAAAVDAAVQAEMTRQQVVGVAIGVITNGHISYLKGYGFADRDRHLPVTLDSMFRWASCSKPLAAVAAMQLVQTGALDLNADVRTYVHEFPDKKATITVRDLLCHQSGIPHYKNGPVIETKRSYGSAHPYSDPLNALDKFKDSSLLFPPGEKYSYSSYGFVLLSAVIQRAGKQPFATQIDQRIVQPLGLTTLQLDYQWKNISHRVAGYTLLNATTIAPSTDTDQSWKAGAGGFISDIGDFAKFAEALLQGTLVTKESEKLMWTPQKTRDGTPTACGLGFFVSVNPDGTVTRVSHEGEQEKTRTSIVICPPTKNSVVIMTNCQWVNPQPLSSAVLTLLGAPNPAPATAPQEAPPLAE